MLSTLMFLAMSRGMAASGPTRPHAAACESVLTTVDVARLRREFHRLLPLGAGPLRTEKKRLTKIVIGRVTEQLRRLTRSRREEFLVVLERAYLGPMPGLKGVNPDLIKSADGALTVLPEVGLMMLLDDYQGTSLMNWLTLDHELSHLGRHVSGAGSVAATLEHVERLRQRRLGIYREEIGAFRESYRFLHEAYPAERLKALERMVGALPPVDLSPLVSAGIVQIKADGTIDVDGTRLAYASRALNTLLDRWVERESELKFLDEVRIAHEQREAEYVREVVGAPKYRRMQRRAAAAQPLRRLLTRLDSHLRHYRAQLPSIGQSRR